MKTVISILLFLTLNCSYSQIKQISPSKIIEVGKIDKCEYDDNGSRNCEWLASLSYGLLNNQRIYTLKFQYKYGKLGDKPQKRIRKISFNATESEINYLYNQISSWTENQSANKPERIYFEVGEHTLEVSSRNEFPFGQEIYFVFDEPQSESNNFWINGFLFEDHQLGKLFGKN